MFMSATRRFLNRFLFCFLFHCLLCLLQSVFSFFLKLKIMIRIFPIHLYNRIDIFRLLHSSFYLKWINPRIDQFRQNVYCTQILQTHQICRFLSIYLIRKTARLCALSSVAAPSTDHTAEKTLAGITIAQCSMYKTFHLQSRLSLHITDFPERKFSRRHDSRDSVLF